MKTVGNKYVWVFMIGLGLISSGCFRVMVETGKKVLEDRTTDDQVTDTKIDAEILSGLSDKDKGLLLDVSTDVWEQRVLLTGTLDDPAVRKEVVQMAKSDTRVKEVYDEIQLVTPEEKERRRKEAEEHDKKDTEGMGQSVDDFWIATKIEAQLIGEDGVTSVNYRWRSVRNQIYLIGRAGSQAELNKVLEIIRNTEGVSSVKHFVQIKPVQK